MYRYVQQQQQCPFTVSLNMKYAILLMFML